MPPGAAEPGIGLGRVTVGVALQSDADGAVAELKLLEGRGRGCAAWAEQGTVRWPAGCRARS
ncbi:MAG: hypothetical protein R3F60_12310 [bacterium]